MKSLIPCILACVFLAPMARADDNNACLFEGKDISSQPDNIVAAIKAQKSCVEAEALAQACAYGSSLDVQIAGTAADLCGAELDRNQPTPADKQLLSKMYDACNSKWAHKQGTMYLSINAFCQLDAVEWMVGLTSENSEH